MECPFMTWGGREGYQPVKRNKKIFKSKTFSMPKL